MNTLLKIIYFLIIISSILGVGISKAGQNHKDNTNKSNESPERYVTINFNNIDIRFFIKFISEMTGENFVIDDRVKGNITIVSPTKISAQEASKVFESVLEVYGYTTVKSGNIIKVIPSPDAPMKSIETRLKEERGTPNEQIITQIIPLSYANVGEVKELFTPLVSKSSVILAYKPSNTLIITDLNSNIKRLIYMLKAIDTKDFYPELSVFPIKNTTAKTVVELLESFFLAGKQDDKNTIKAKFIADKRTNSVFLACNKTDIVRIKKMIDLLDKSELISKDKIKKYSLENATAEKLATILSGLKGGKEEPLISDKVKILPDKETNSLVILAEKDEHLLLENIIKELDDARTMVYIECLIMEVNVNKNFEIGTEWQTTGKTSIDTKEAMIGSGFINGENLSNSSYVNQLQKGILNKGFSLGVLGESLQVGNIVFPNIAAVIHAFQKDKDVNILSTPQLLTMDNEEASIKVGKNIPYQTKSGSTSGGESYNTYEYKDVGLTLKITPNINKNGHIRLKISEQIEKVDDLSMSDVKPTTLKRNIDTTVIVKNKNTVVIGGLIDDSFSTTKYNVPCLGDIPGLGWLFRSMSKSREKTNLFVFITPQIIKNANEGEAFSNSKKEQMNKLRKEIPQSITPKKDELKMPEKKQADASIDEHDMGFVIPAAVKDKNINTIKGQEFRKDVVIHIISLKNSIKAKKLVNSFKKKGYPAYQSVVNIPGKGLFHRISISYYKDNKKASIIFNKLKKEKIKWYLLDLKTLFNRV